MKIQNLQCKNDIFFADGLFPSERYIGRWKKKKEKKDNTIFYSAMIVYSLQTMRKDFAAGSREIIDSIAARTIRNYPKYRSRNGDITYNFWQTYPEMYMPGSIIFSRIDKIKLADDFDDTSLIYLTKEKNDSLDNLLKQKFSNHISSEEDKVIGLPKKYRKHSAYLTWFGKKLVPEIDICVMANTMLYVLDRKFELNKYDKATIELIKQMVLNNDHLYDVKIISPYYMSSAIIMYHVARLMAKDNNTLFEDIRPKIIADLQNELKRSTNKMDHVMLLISLYRLNVKPDYRINLSELNFNDFSFYKAEPLHGNPLYIKRIIGKSDFFQFGFRSQAHCWSLILELLVLTDEARIPNDVKN